MNDALAQPGGTTWPWLLERLVGGGDLDEADTRWALGEVMSGTATQAQLAGLLVALRAKGETVAEVAGLADAMLSFAVPLEVPGPALDVVGTGGDGHGTVNVSTMAALVAAGAGATVVKHGNRAASSHCGTADVLERLGLDLDRDPEQVAAAARETGITFAFAQRFHPAMRHVAPVRSQLGVRTVFNSLGPLTNPARPAAMLLGVADARQVAMMAGVLARRGTTALVARGEDGLDELSTTAPSDVHVVVGGVVARTSLLAAELGLPQVDLAALRGGDVESNADAVRRVLGGEQGAVADVVVLNAAAGLLAADLAAAAAADPSAAGGLAARTAGDLPAALAGPLARARESLTSGGAEQRLHAWLGLPRR